MDLIKKREACTMLAISMNTLDKLIRSGKLPAYRVTETSVRLAREDVTAYLESRRIQPPPPPVIRRRKPAPAAPKCEYYPGMKVV